MFVSKQENTPVITKQTVSLQDGPAEAAVTEGDMKVRVERELVSQAEEEDMEALLGTYVVLFSCADIDLTVPMYLCAFMYICKCLGTTGKYHVN